MMGLDHECADCRIVLSQRFERGSTMAVAFAPAEPVIDGHLVVIPRIHVPDAAASPSITAETMRFAALLAEEVGDTHLLTWSGQLATEGAPHLRIHLVPRSPGLVLTVPWTGQVIAHG